MHFLVAESETAEQRAQRREHTGQSAGETYAATLSELAPDAEVELIAPADADAPVLSPKDLAGFDAVFVTGSPLHVYDDTPEVRRQLAFVTRLFASGTPGFGSCAGLQLAIAAVGGRIRPVSIREAGIARRITRTEAGRDHPLLAGRGPAWDAPTVHTDEVETMPAGAICLATNAASAVQAAEIRHGLGVFWGVQYHPELSLEEVAGALRRQATSLVEAGVALTEGAVIEQAELIEALHLRPERLDLCWRLGLDGEIADTDQRRVELTNFIRHLVIPMREQRRGSEVGVMVAA